MPEIHSAFCEGEMCRLCDLEHLIEFERGMMSRMKQKPRELLEKAANSECRISLVSYPMNNDVYYGLVEFPDFQFRECCLLDAMLGQPHYDAPLASEYYRIQAEVRNGHPYAVVYDPGGVECLVSRKADVDAAVAAMQYVAKIRHIDNFDSRFEFSGTWSYTQGLGSWSEKGDSK